MSSANWHRPVSPIFFLLLLVAGLAVGLVCFLAMPAVLQTLGA